MLELREKNSIAVVISTFKSVKRVRRTNRWGISAEK